jgi:hypothetical protein
MIRYGLFGALFILFGTVAITQDSAPETSPQPQSRPAAAEPAALAQKPAPTATEPEPVAVDVRETLTESPAALALCLAALNRAGATYTRVDPIGVDDETGCGVANPLELTAVATGVTLTPASAMRCDTALALATWVRTFVQPAATLMGDRGALTGMTIGAGTQCRSRNNTPDGVLSEHAFGNAVDIMAFTFSAGNPIGVQAREREGTMAEAFQRTVRAGACLTFSTVLGPGSDAAHDNHLHLDIKARTGGFRLCQ